MADHGARDHATWSASATARNVHCPGALAISRFAPPEKESEHAARGTACHQVAEKCLRNGLDPADFLGKIERTKQHQIEIDDELVASAEMYVDYVRGMRDAADGCQLWIEQKFDLSPLGPPFDAGGTGDAVLYYPGTRLLEVVDLKNGMGVVDVTDNPQLRTYALGALLQAVNLKVSTVRSTVVQPRAGHPDGRIRSETFHVADLLAWTADLLAAMNKSRAAMDAFDACNGNSVLLDAWADEWLKPGKCKFCPVEGTCPLLRKKALAAADVWLDDLDQPRIGNAALDMSPEALARDLDMIPMLEDWIKARRATAHSMAETGTEIPNYVLVEKEGREAWIDGKADEAIKIATEAGLKAAAILNPPKPKTPKQIRAALKKAKADDALKLIADLSETPVRGTNLVRADHTTRQPVQPADAWLDQ